MRKKISTALLPAKLLFCSAGLAFASPASLPQTGSKANTLSIERIEMKPTRDGFYDASVALIVHDPKLGKDGRVTFAIPIAHVHDADEAIDKVHDSIKMMSEDLRQGYFDLHREP